MCLRPCPVEPLPDETARVARAAFPKGNTYLRMRDELGAIFEDEQVRAPLFEARQAVLLALAPGRRGQRILGVAFSRSVCGVCPGKDLCIRSTSHASGHGRPRRELTVTSEEHYEALRLEALALPRPGEDAPATLAHRCGHELRQGGRVALRNTPGPNAYLAVRRTHGKTDQRVAGRRPVRSATTS